MSLPQVPEDIEFILVNSIESVKTMVDPREGLKVFCVVVDMNLLGVEGRIITCEMPF